MRSVRRPPFPKQESPKNKSRIAGMFFVPENRPSKCQLLPASHHEFTIKKPRFAARFSQNPQQKTPNLITPKNTDSQND
jgi:hypothetical protein